MTLSGGTFLCLIFKFTIRKIEVDDGI